MSEQSSNQLPAIRQPLTTPCKASTLPAQCERLQPAGAKQGTSELLACLTLVAPSGMTADERGQWVQVARQTLSGIPADLLARGCDHARRTCRFPSEIVPAILAEVQSSWNHRKRVASRSAEQPIGEVPRLAKPEYIKPEEAAKILHELGLKRDWSQGDAA